MHDLPLLVFKSWIQISRLCMQWLPWFDNFVSNVSNIAIITVKDVDYRCIIQNISKSEANNLSENSVLNIYRDIDRDIDIDRGCT